MNPCGDCVRSSSAAIPSGLAAITGYKVGKALGQSVVKTEPEVVHQVTINQAAGAAFERQVREFMEQTHSGVVSQVPIRTRGGVKTRIDLMARDASGKSVYVECKASVVHP